MTGLTGDRSLREELDEVAENVRGISQALYGPPARPNGLIGEVASLKRMMVEDQASRRRSRTAIIVAVITASATVLAALAAAAAVVLGGA